MSDGLKYVAAILYVRISSLLLSTDSNMGACEHELVLHPSRFNVVCRHLGRRLC